MIKNLILSGGAFRCCSHIGCVKYLEEHDVLKNITSFIGTSAGSIIACLLCLGFTSTEMTLVLNEFFQMQEECPPDLENILNLYYTMGLSDGQLITMFINRMIQKKVKDYNATQPMTFIQLAKHTGKNLVVYACKLPTLDKAYFSVDTTPDLEIALAIRASCSLPFIFTPITINNDMYIDAGIINNFPHDYVSNNKLKDTLGIHIKGSDKHKALPENLNIMSYMRIILNGMMQKLNASYGEAPSSVMVIQITQDDSDGFDINFDMSTCTFRISKEKVNALIEEGYNCISKKFQIS